CPFFFSSRRRHTRFSRDWSSDVCSSDLRSHGARVPGRLIVSAKSWLSHPGVDRTAPILPWGAPADVAKLSPTQASSLLLAHMARSEEHTSELQSRENLVCRLLLEKKNTD